ncbi:MAG: hypothetical protein JO362_16285 [Streptomycetaceae bacterium]|nr:hypothetical protein [Streptomycetaceae bacterium]
MYQFVDPVLAERGARRRRAVVAAVVAFAFLGGTGYVQTGREFMGLICSGATPWADGLHPPCP